MKTRNMLALCAALMLAGCDTIPTGALPSTETYSSFSFSRGPFGSNWSSVTVSRPNPYSARSVPRQLPGTPQPWVYRGLFPGMEIQGNANEDHDTNACFVHTTDGPKKIRCPLSSVRPTERNVPVCDPASNSCLRAAFYDTPW